MKVNLMTEDEMTILIKEIVLSFNEVTEVTLKLNSLEMKKLPFSIIYNIVINAANNYLFNALLSALANRNDLSYEEMILNTEKFVAQFQNQFTSIKEGLHERIKEIQKSKYSKTYFKQELLKTLKEYHDKNCINCE